MTDCLGNCLFGDDIQNVAMEDWAEMTKAKHTLTMRVLNQTNTRSLIEPEVRLSKGKLFNELPTLPPGKSCNVVFYKTPWTLRGIVGLVAYQVERTSKVACVYFSNPLIGPNILGLEWLTVDDMENENLDEMLNNFEKKRNVSAKTWKTDDIPSHYQLADGLYTARVTMCGTSKVALELTILESNLKIDRSLTVTSWMENQNKLNK